MTDASSVIARLRELNAARTPGTWTREVDDEATDSITSDDIEGWVARGVDHHDAAAIVAALNAQEALLNVAEEAARVCYAMEANTADGAPEGLRAALAALAKAGGAE